MAKRNLNKKGYVMLIQPAANGKTYRSAMNIEFDDVLLAKEYVSLKNYEARTQARLLSIESHKDVEVNREYVLVTNVECK